MNPRLIGIFCVLATSVFSFVQKSALTSADDCGSVRAADFHDSKAPAFSDYPAAAEKAITNPKLDQNSNPIARRYRTQLREQIGYGPNFAGHYSVAFWGCGTSCAMFAVVDLKTGKVMTPREFTTIAGENLDADDFLPRTESDSWALRFRRDSALLVVLGAPDEGESATRAFYYVVQGDRLLLIHTTHVLKRCEDAKPSAQDPRR